MATCNPFFNGYFQCDCTSSTSKKGSVVAESQSQPSQNSKILTKWKLTEFRNKNRTFDNTEYCRLNKKMNNVQYDFFEDQGGDVLKLNLHRVHLKDKSFRKISWVDQMLFSIASKPETERSSLKPDEVFKHQSNPKCKPSRCSITSPSSLSESLPWTLNSLNKKANKTYISGKNKTKLRNMSHELCKYFFTFTGDMNSGSLGGGYYENLNFALAVHGATNPSECSIPVWTIGSACGPDSPGDKCFNELKNQYKAIHKCSYNKPYLQHFRKELLSAIAGYVRTVDAFSNSNGTFSEKFSPKNRCNSLTKSGMMCTKKIPTGKRKGTVLSERCNSQAWKDLSQFDKNLKNVVTKENLSSVTKTGEKGQKSRERARRKLCSLCRVIAPLNEIKESEMKTFRNNRGFGTFKETFASIPMPHMKISDPKTMCHNLMMGQGYKYNHFVYKDKFLTAPRPKASAFGVDPSWNVYCPSIKVETEYSGQPGVNLKRRNWSNLIKASRWPTGRTIQDVKNNTLFGSSISGVTGIRNDDTTIYSAQVANDQLIKNNYTAISRNSASYSPCVPSGTNSNYLKFAQIDASGNFKGVGNGKTKTTKTGSGKKFLVPLAPKFNGQKKLLKVTGTNDFLNQSIQTNLGGANRKYYGPNIFVPFYQIYSCANCPKNGYKVSPFKDKCIKTTS